MVTSITVDPADDRIDDQMAKAWWVSVRRTNWLTRKRRWNFSLHLCASVFQQKEMVMVCDKERCIWAYSGSELCMNDSMMYLFIKSS